MWKEVGAFTAGLIIGILISNTSHAQDKGEWFDSLRQPKTGYSCCNISDCKQTIAVYQGGQWWTTVPDRDGRIAPVPEDKILENPKTLDGEAYVCSTPSVHPDNSSGYYIKCFIPPWTGF